MIEGPNELRELVHAVQMAVDGGNSFEDVRRELEKAGYSQDDLFKVFSAYEATMRGEELPESRGAEAPDPRLDKVREYIAEHPMVQVGIGAEEEYGEQPRKRHSILPKLVMMLILIVLIYLLYTYVLADMLESAALL